MENLRFILYFSCLLPLRLLSQDYFEEGFKPKWSHSFGAGSHYIYNYYSKDEVRDMVQYTNPGAFVFYRLIRTNEKNENTCFTLNAGYRQFNSYTSNKGYGDVHYTQGSVQCIRMDFGASHLFTKGPNNGFAIGGGVYFGGLVYAAGNIQSTSSSIKTGTSETHSTSPYNELSVLHMGLNIEIQQKIPVSTSFLVVGLKAGIETPEGFDAVGPGKIISGYIGYIFPAKIR